MLSRFPLRARLCFPKTTPHRQEQARGSLNRQATTFALSDGLETVGIEPTTPCLQSRRSPTELRPHKPATKQRNSCLTASPLHDQTTKGLVGQGGLEPPTPRLSSVCSNQLSYWPIGPASEDAPRSANNRKDARPAPRCSELHQHKAEPRTITRSRLQA